MRDANDSAGRHYKIELENFGCGAVACQGQFVSELLRRVVDLVRQRYAGSVDRERRRLPGNWSVAQIGDCNDDAMSDILLLDSAGNVAVWEMNGATVSSSLASKLFVRRPVPSVERNSIHVLVRKPMLSVDKNFTPRLVVINYVHLSALPQPNAALPSHRIWRVDNLMKAHSWPKRRSATVAKGLFDHLVGAWCLTCSMNARSLGKT
jgi:hypothetical protein